MTKPLHLVAIVAAAATATGCAGFRQAVGVEKVTPDEFRVVTKAPLVIPPDYALRPPRPGDPRPQELRPDASARAAIFGQDIGRSASQGEQLLVSRAGASAVDPAIRAQVDLEGGDLVRKPEAFADRVIGTAAPLDAEAQAQEDEVIRRSTGGGEVVIPRPESLRPKLPGT